MTKKVVSHTDLDVYRRAFDAAMQVFHLSQRFPRDEAYSLTDQIRRSSRSICANLAEAWRRRRYAKAFVNKLSESEAEVAETQVWLEFAVKCGYLSPEDGRPLYAEYEEITRMLVAMIRHPDKWTLG